MGEARPLGARDAADWGTPREASNALWALAVPGAQGLHPLDSGRASHRAWAKAAGVVEPGRGLAAPYEGLAGRGRGV